MGSYTARSSSPVSLFNSVKQNRALIYNLAKREVVGRYRGSAIGLLWSFLNPLLMLLVYTFVFSVVFGARWVGGSDSRVEFALVLFAGLLVFNLFAECVTRAPTLILNNVNYVKKVVFPLEILPVVVMGSAAFHFLVSLLVWLLFYVVFFGMPSFSLLWLPLVVLPLMLMTLGISWFLASLGVYLRDVSQVIGVVTTALLFLSPIFYPVLALPESYRPYMQLSPLTFVVEQARGVMIWGAWPAWGGWLSYTAIALATFSLGFAWFQRTRKGFPDVL